MLGATEELGVEVVAELAEEADFEYAVPDGEVP